VVEVVHEFEQIHSHMLLENEQLILGSAAALSDDLIVGQVFMGFFQRLFVRPYKRIEPFDDSQQFYDNEIYGVMLVYVNQLMIDDTEKIMLGYVGFVQKKIIEKGKRGGILFDIHDVQLPAFLASILMDEPCKLSDFISETDKEKQNPKKIDHPDNFCQTDGRGDSSSALRGDVSRSHFFCRQKRGGYIDKWKDKREGNGKQQVEPVDPEECLSAEKNPVNNIKQAQANT
jgi:hypothetical protein